MKKEKGDQNPKETIEALLKKIVLLQNRQTALQNKVLRCENQKLKLEHKLLVLKKNIPGPLSSQDLEKRLKQAKEMAGENDQSQTTKITPELKQMIDKIMSE